MSEKNTTLPSLSNQDWKKVEVKTEKINKLLPNIPQKKHHWTKRVNLGRSETGPRKNQCSSRKPEQKYKIWAGN